MNRRFRFVAVGAVCLVAVGLAQAVVAQGPGEPAGLEVQATGNPASSIRPPYTPEWGIAAPIAYNVPAWTFNDRGGTQHEFLSPLGYVYFPLGGPGYLDQTLYLPSGAVIDGMTTFFYDQHPSEDVYLSFLRVGITGSADPTNFELLVASSSGTGGYQASYHALAAPETVRNYEGDQMNAYLLIANMWPVGGNPGYLRFGGVTVWYRLQISPAPATATFSDVPTGYWAFRHIEALAASGITAGCGGGNFCPENYVKRSEMAVYLAKALGLHWPDANTLP